MDEDVDVDVDVKYWIIMDNVVVFAYTIADLE